MTIDQAKQLVDFITNKNQRGYSTGVQFNLLAPIAQLSVLNDRLGNIKKYSSHDPVPAYGFNLNQKSRQELKPVMKEPTSYPVTAGVVAFPADLIYIDTVTNAANGKLIVEATEDEIVILNNSLITPPSAIYPKFVIHSNGFNIYPTTGVANIKLSYIRKPLTPVWNYTLTNDREVYDASGSQDFELAETTHLEIVMSILQNMGMNLTMTDVVQYAAAKEAQGV
jgi:hypothetical protein